MGVNTTSEMFLKPLVKTRFKDENQNKKIYN
jgi:hypothetical protein